MFSLFQGSTKNRKRLIVEGSDLHTTIKPDQTVLKAALAAKIKIPNYCGVGECGTCRCRITEGSVRLKIDITRHIPIEDIREGYVLACQSIAESDLVIQIPGLSATDHSLTHADGKITELIRLTHDIYEVRFKLEHPIRYVAGQYAQLTVPGVEALADTPRNYSFAHAAGKEATDTVAFYIRHVPGGLFTDWLFAADRTGTRLHVAGPYGDFRYQATQRPLLCMAGGSGLAPVLALLEQLKADGVAQPVTFLFGARQQRDLYYLDQIAAIAGAWPASFAFHPVLSHEPETSDWSGRRGFVTEHLSHVVPNLADHDAYLCGPPAMLDAVIAKVKDKIPAARIHFDKFLDQSVLHTAADSGRRQAA